MFEVSSTDTCLCSLAHRFSKYSRIFQACLEFPWQLLPFVQPASCRCQRGCHIPVSSYVPIKRNESMTGTVMEQANPADHHVRSTVGQIWRVGGYEHYGSYEQWSHCVGTHCLSHRCRNLFVILKLWQYLL